MSGCPAVLFVNGFVYNTDREESRNSCHLSILAVHPIDEFSGGRERIISQIYIRSVIDPHAFWRIPDLHCARMETSKTADWCRCCSACSAPTAVVAAAPAAFLPHCCRHSTSAAAVVAAAAAAAAPAAAPMPRCCCCCCPSASEFWMRIRVCLKLQHCCRTWSSPPLCERLFHAVSKTVSVDLF